VAGIEGNFDGKVRNGQIACDIAPPANGTVKLETVNGQALEATPPGAEADKQSTSSIGIKLIWTIGRPKSIDC
jgi:hypothetical protein